jgi:Nucleoside-diphosphate-sugar epimerases
MSSSQHSNIITVRNEGCGVKRIVVFGATGSIGAYFMDNCLQNLDRGEWEVIAVGRKETDFFTKNNIPYFRADISKADGLAALPKEDVFAIVNLAGVLPAYQRDEDVIKYASVNIMGGLRILEYAKSVGADRVLYTQTWADLAGYWGKESLLFPRMSRNLVYTGDHAFYAISKSMIVDAMEYYHQQYGIKNFVFRLPNIYHYSPIKTYFVNGVEKNVAYRYMIERARQGLDIEMWGDPEAFKDIVYVKDLCQMMRKALTANVDGGIYNAGTGTKTTLHQQIKGIIDVFSPPDCRSKIIPCPEKGSFTSFVMDISNARTELGYEPQYDYISYLEDYRSEMEQKRFDVLWM